MKRILFLLGAVGIIAIVVGLGYFIRYRGSINGEAPTPQLPEAPPQAGAPVTSTAPVATQPLPGQKFGVVAGGPVADYYAGDQNVLTLIRQDGSVVQMSAGRENVVSGGSLSNLSSASFSADGKGILATFGNAGSFQSSLFEVLTKSWRPLPQEVQSPAWSPTDGRIIYLATASNLSTLVTLDTGNPKARPQTLFGFSAEDVRLTWVAPNRLVVSEGSSAYARSSIWSVDLKSRSVSPLVAKQLGATGLWDPETGRGVVFSGYPNQRGGYLTLIDEGGRTAREFSIFTLPSKCAFEKRSVAPLPAKATSSPATSTAASPPPSYSLVCAIPRNTDLLRQSPLPDAYETRALFTEDDFYRINLSNGDVEPLFVDGAQHLDAANLKIAGGRLFFVNRYDGKLYAIAL